VRLRNPAHGQIPVLIRANQAGRAGTTRDNPGDRIPPRQSLEIRELELLPTALRQYLSLPMIGQLGKQGHRAAVFDAIG